VILLLGDVGEEVLGFVVSRLAQSRAEFMLIEARADRRAVDLAWRADGDGGEGWLRSGEQAVSLHELRSVYLRDVGRGDQTPTAGMIVSMSGLLEAVPALVVNRPSAIASNASKPFQSQIIARDGFSVPRTLVTTIPAEAALFYERCGGHVVFKSVSYQRSIVRKMTRQDLARLNQVRRTPTQFQEYVPGVDVRVHVVGDELFATEILSTATDYRYTAREDQSFRMRDIELPPEIATRCRSLARSLELVMAGIDLRRTPDGQWFCFEANGSPGFTYYQGHSGQPIGDALVALLHRGTPSRTAGLNPAGSSRLVDPGRSNDA
jgi:glutathione synthase/RimK-type ligase-like ATP-grasp enzyme